MPLEDFIIWVYCWVDQKLNESVSDTPLRSRGFPPKLSDAEVLTMELIGEFLGIDTDQGIWRYFRCHWREWFPQLGSRSQFAKQASNLWAFKLVLQHRLTRALGAEQDPVHFIDGFPIPVCLFKRAPKCRRFKGEADFGYCASKEQTFYGFRGHVLVDFHGTITSFTLTNASEDERVALWDIVERVRGLVLGDKGYLGAHLKQELFKQEVCLETPLRSNMRDTRDPALVKCMTSTRRLVETVIGQLSERFHIEKVWARDLWHLTNRLGRKILAHSLGVLINRTLGRDPLQFDGLIVA